MRQLASEITAKGATIHEFLGQELKMKSHRNQAIQRNYELGQVENALHSKMKKMELQITQKQEAIDSVATTEASLDQKIEKKNQELQRLRKRLDTIKNIRYLLLRHAVKKCSSTCYYFVLRKTSVHGRI